LCWESKCDLSVIEPVDWKQHRLPHPGNYTNRLTRKTTQTAQPWKLHTPPDPENYTDCPILKTTQTLGPAEVYFYRKFHSEVQKEKFEIITLYA
jgi:hypothetical protein